MTCCQFELQRCFIAPRHEINSEIANFGGARVELEEKRLAGGKRGDSQKILRHFCLLHSSEAVEEWAAVFRHVMHYRSKL